MQTRLILELGCNHQGNIDTAKKMIDDAQKLGVWGIKLQKRDVEGLHVGIKLIPRKPENSFGKNYYEHRKALEFSVKQMDELKTHAEERGINFEVSVFDIKSAEDMLSIGVKNIKLPSQHYSNYALNTVLFDRRDVNIARQSFSIFVSCGMHSLKEILNWQFFDKSNVLFYCRSLYPCDFDQVALSNFIEIKNRLKESIIGYSSHEKEGKAIPYTVLLGAKYIERHYTRDKELKGSDHKTVSSTFVEILMMQNDIETVEEMLYNNTSLTDAEKKVRKLYRGF